MAKIKKIIKKATPGFIISAYHYLISVLGQMIFGMPTNKMVVIGVTGTKGKTSTANFIWAVLSTKGKAGMISTANIRIGEREIINRYHMSMPGRLAIPRLMKNMLKDGCLYCVIETTSEGIKQYRHSGINYDYAVFTNLSPEHLPSHKNSFEEYKKAKGKMFSQLTKRKRKKIRGRKIKKIIIANKDDDNYQYFSSFKADEKIFFSLEKETAYRAEKITELPRSIEFFLNGEKFKVNVPGKFNAYNALPAIIIGKKEKIGNENIRSGLLKIKTIPGRMEEISIGGKQKFTVFVDYAHEGKSIRAALEAVNKIKAKGQKTIILLGAEGGGRDKRKRPIMGKTAAELADYLVVSNVDPYEDNPKEIIEDIAKEAEKYGKKRDETLFPIEDRRKGIKKAISLANNGDVVIITGKGSEQSITIGGKTYPWDDRTVVREELKKLLGDNN